MMGLRFRRSIKILPGVRLNFSGRGVSTTVGRPGASVNISKRGVRGTVGLPSSGLSYSAKLFGDEPQRPVPILPMDGAPRGANWLAIGTLLLLAVLIIWGSFGG